MRSIIYALMAVAAMFLVGEAHSQTNAMVHMPERSYTVTELDALRQAVETKWLFGSYRPRGNGGMSRSYKSEEKTIAVEQMVRTHMLAGHTAKDLYESESSAHNGN